MKQIHADNCVNILYDTLNPENSVFPHYIEDTDALICEIKVITLGVLTADCLPLFYIDYDKPAIAAVHAGRVGINKGIHKRALERLIELGHNVSSIYARIGPSIGPCCYPSDLWSIIEKDLVILGIKSLFNEKICTSCNNNRYFSYRKEKDSAGRMLSYIMME